MTPPTLCSKDLTIPLTRLSRQNPACICIHMYCIIIVLLVNILRVMNIFPECWCQYLSQRRTLNSNVGSAQSSPGFNFFCTCTPQVLNKDQVWSVQRYSCNQTLTMYSMRLWTVHSAWCVSIVQKSHSDPLFSHIFILATCREGV